MAITVNFKAKDFLGKDYSLIDTFDNIEKVSDGWQRIINQMDKVEEEKGDKLRFIDYERVINKQVLKETALILGLNKEETEKLKSTSFSDIFKFYNELCTKFAQMEVPSVKKMMDLANGNNIVNTEADKVDEDPKLTVAE